MGALYLEYFNEEETQRFTASALDNIRAGRPIDAGGAARAHCLAGASGGSPVGSPRGTPPRIALSPLSESPLSSPRRSPVRSPVRSPNRSPVGSHPSPVAAALAAAAEVELHSTEELPPSLQAPAPAPASAPLPPSAVGVTPERSPGAGAPSHATPPSQKRTSEQRSRSLDASGLECSSSPSSVKRTAKPRIPAFFTPPDAPLPHATVQAEVRELQQLLAKGGHREESALSATKLAALLPHLPRGGVPSYLSRAVWLHVATTEAAGRAAAAGAAASAQTSAPAAQSPVGAPNGHLASPQAAGAPALGDDPKASASRPSSDGHELLLAEPIGTPPASPSTPPSPLISPSEARGAVTAGAFCRFFARLLAGVPPDERALRCVLGARDGWLEATHLLPVLSDVVARHPSLRFLADEVCARALARARARTRTRVLAHT